MIATWRLVLFSLPAIPAAMLLIPVTVHLPAFYARDVGLGLSTVGVILFATRLWDVIIDPLIGSLSDRTSTRFGRRRPWIVLGAPLTVIAMWALFRPPAGAGALYLLGGGLALYLGWTMMVLPYQAWAAELSRDYHERSRIAGWREGFGVFGTLIALVLPVAAGIGADAAANLSFLAVLVMIALPLAVVAALSAVKEPVRPRGDAVLSWRSGIAALRWNGPFKRLILAYLLNGFANGLPPTLFLLFVGDVLKSPEQAGLALVIYFAAGILAAPFWIWASKRIGKHWAWIISMIWACVFFLFVPFLGPGDTPLFLLICVLTGVSFGADLALPASMQADVIDLDAARSGQARAGLYFALWAMASKLALAIAVGAAFPILDWVGYAEGRDNSRSALLTISLLYGFAPVLFKAAAIAIMWRYPLTADRHAALRAALEKRRHRKDLTNATHNDRADRRIIPALGV